MLNALTNFSLFFVLNTAIIAIHFGAVHITNSIIERRACGWGGALVCSICTFSHQSRYRRQATAPLAAPAEDQLGAIIFNLNNNSLHNHHGAPEHWRMRTVILRKSSLWFIHSFIRRRPAELEEYILILSQEEEAKKNAFCEILRFEHYYFIRFWYWLDDGAIFSLSAQFKY